MDDCPPWLHPGLLHLVLGCGYWGVLLLPLCLLICISIFKMALSRGAVVSQMLKLERRPKLVSGITVRDCDLPVLTRGMPPCSNPGQGLSDWILAAPDQTLWTPREPLYSW